MPIRFSPARSPGIYDTYFVPLIFSDFADDIARRVAALSPSALLETAAGTGAVTRAVAAALPHDFRYVATDLNEPMLAIAAQRQAGDPRISWRQADASALAFDDTEFDVVCCQFGAMFFPDRVKAYAETKRVLKPNGTFLFNVWDRIEENVFAHEVTMALGELFPDDPPRFMARTPRQGRHQGRSRRRRLPRHIDRNETCAKSRANGRTGCVRLLPGHTAAFRDRGKRRQQASGRNRRRH